MISYLKILTKSMMSYLKYQRYKQYLPKDPRATDLYIVEFPKSGMTWLASMLATIIQIENNVNLEINMYNHGQIIPGVDGTRFIGEWRFKFPPFRIIRSHSPYNPYYNFVVYLLRSPFSVMQSYYNYLKDNINLQMKFEEFIKSERFGIKSWIKHVESWTIGVPSTQAIVYLTYESLIDDTEMTLTYLLDLLGWRVSNKAIKIAIKENNFVKMQNKEKKYKKNNRFDTTIFVREGKEYYDISEDAYSYIYQCAKPWLKIFWPNLLKNERS